jgi:serine/threonine protein kinase
MIMTPLSIQNSLQDRYLDTEDRYVIESVLDQGGIGTIYLATDIRLDRQVAIKLLKKPLPNTLEISQRYKREVELRAVIDNAHIAKILDSGINSEGFPFYVMEYLQGRSLEQILQHETLLPIEQAMNIALQICLAMEAFHKVENARSNQSGFVSQDLKPTHIFLLPTASGEQVKVLDSGFAKRARTYCSDSHYTNLRSLLQGTCKYSAPEQLEPAEEIDCRADIYILGIILFEMFSGANPFSFDVNSPFISEISWVRAHTEQIPLPLQSLLGDCQTSFELSNIVDKCLQKTPSDRHVSMQALREALELVKVSDLLSPEQTQSDRRSRPIMAFAASAESSPAESSKDLTFIQAASPLLELEEAESKERNDETVVQILADNSAQNSHRSVALAKHVSVATENPGVADSIRPSYALDHTSESEHSIPKPTRAAAVQNNCIGLSSTAMDASDEDGSKENIIFQYSDRVIHQSVDQTVAQYSDPVIHSPVDQTIIQYSDSAIHRPADRTVAQAIAPFPDKEVDQTVHQQSIPQSKRPTTLANVQNNRAQSQIVNHNAFQDVLHRTGSFASGFINLPGRFFRSIWMTVDFKQWKFRPRPTRQLAAAGSSAGQPSPGPIAQPANRPTRDGMSIEEQPNSAQHQKTLRELDHCRLTFAKELARNGKFRDAIAQASQISETSRFFRDSQTLIRSWKQL